MPRGRKWDEVLIGRHMEFMEADQHRPGCGLRLAGWLGDKASSVGVHAVQSHRASTQKGLQEASRSVVTV